MDRIEALGSQLSKITMYDIKTAYNQAKNMVLNVSEMEAKVQEATNDDPWGASSTLMGEIAQGTFNFQNFNEIMPAIYSRFMDKEAREWRSIYKALQLLEYIIKHGSERVVDDARSHLSTLKMLRNFHYIDEKGKDQGINVRNRAKEIAEMLGDLDRVRQERRKAKMNKNKYTGTGNDPMGFGSGGSRYGGFSSDDYYGSSGGGGSYSGGGGGYSGNYGTGGGGGSGGFSDSTGRKEFEEYDAGEWEDSAAGSSTAHRKSTSIPSRTTGAARSTTTSSPVKPAVPAKDKAKEEDLLGFGFDDDVPAPVVAAAPAPALSSAVTQPTDDFDDFDDFQSAPTVSVAPTLQPAPTAVKPAVPLAGGANVFDLLNATASPAPAPAPMMARPSYGGSSIGTGVSGSGFGGAAPLMPSTSMTPSTAYKPSTPVAGRPAPAAGTTAKSSTNFDDLWSSTLTSTVGRSSTPVGGSTSGAGKTMLDLQKEKAQAAFWGAGQNPNQGKQAKPATMGTGFGGTAPSNGAGGGLDDLLL